MTNNKFPRGSEWRKWDLHVHTPSSYDYGDKSVTNEDIINKLAENNISAVSITDHHIIDVDRIKELQKIGKEKNIVVFPGIEFLSDARGSEPIHFIAIFGENSNIEYIWGQLENKTNISKIKGEGKKENEVYCDLNDTINLVHELGGIVTIHSGQKHGSIECITNSLSHTIAQKTDIAKLVDIYELGKEEDQKGYREIVFPAIGKVLPMIICSDNHNVNKYFTKQNCWIKADPTFEGLKQIIYEPEERVFIGEKPEVLDRVKNNKTKYIKKLKIDQVEGYNDKRNIWFKNQEIELNKELVAIIGNKGNGKSAIADILGFLGNTHNSGEGKDSLFSFLNPERFGKSKLANNFEGILEWEDISENQKNLGTEKIDKTKGEKVRYLPQNYFNDLTNEVEIKKFDKILENVIFSHLEESKKLGQTSFNDLKDYKSKIISSKIDDIKSKLAELNRKVVKLERQKQPEELEKINNKILEKENELKVQEDLLKELNGKEIKNPNVDTQIGEEKQRKFENIKKINEEIEKINEEIEKEKNNKSLLEIDKQNLQNFLGHFESIEKQISDYKEKNKEIYKNLGLDVEKIIDLKIKKNEVEEKLKLINDSIEKLKYTFIEKSLLNLEQEEAVKKLIEENSLIIKKENLLEQIENIKKELSKQEKEYQDYIEGIKKIENVIKEIKGENNKYDTLEYYKNIKKYISEEDESGKTNLQKELDNLTGNRINLSLEIYNFKKEIIDLYKEFKKPIDNKVEENKEYLNKESQINIDVRFLIKQDFNKNFLNFINQGRRGSFNGKTEGEQLLKEIYNEKNLNEENEVREILNNFVEYLNFDKRKDEKEPLGRNIFDQINELEEFYNYIFGLDYIDTEFELKSGEKSLSELSPGEKGTLLLIFYLMIDEEGIPLIIDQPEDNLDNQSVFSMLSTFIKKAKKKRQIIIVTHNPNLAVGADAEQIIYTKIDKEKGNTFSFESGSIENAIINNHIVNILEGTMTAFNKREIKYIK